jgi:hypothetical protein
LITSGSRQSLINEFTLIAETTISPGLNKMATERQSLPTQLQSRSIEDKAEAPSPHRHLYFARGCVPERYERRKIRRLRNLIKLNNS